MRQPAVADRFYPGSSQALKKELNRIFSDLPPQEKVKAKAVVSPHAGYIYSGSLAAETLSAVDIPGSVLIIGPNHHGRGAPAALSNMAWQMPFGPVQIDTELSEQLLQHAAGIVIDENAHTSEHSLEVQVPLLQQLREELKIVPLVVSQLSFQQCERVATAISSSLKEISRDVLLVASSDMSHYISRKQAEKRDGLALQAINDLDPQALYQTVFDNRISMCGVIPVVIAMLAAKNLGAEESRLIGYTDSGYVSGDSNQVVGYAGVVIL